MRRVCTVLLCGALVGYVLCAAGRAEQAGPAGGTRFELGAGSGRFEAWGRGQDTRSFFPEFLPTLFERKLLFEDTKLEGGRLDWIFTGEHGGFTITIDSAAISLSQRFYDSPGFNAATGETPRHPQWQTQPQGVQHNGVPGELTVVLDHKLGLAVSANGREVLRQECLFDVSRHQLRLAGQDPDQLRVTGRLVKPPPQTVQVTVETEKAHQQMIGFGGITTPTAYAQLSPRGKQRWWELLCEYNLLIQREYPIGARLDRAMDNWDTLADATPHYYGDNFPNGEISDFGYIRELRRLGGKVWFEFWALPPWVGGDVDKYADAVVEYCRVSRDKAEAPPDVVGVQNEVKQTAEKWYAMTLALLMGELYHKNLVLTDAVAICYCWTLLNVVQPSYGWTRSLCVPGRAHGFVPVASSHQLRVFGAYSRRIREGMTRVTASAAADDLLVCAFKGTGSAATVVLLNRGTAPKRARILWPGVVFSEIEVVDPYHQNEARQVDGVGEMLIAPGAVVTATNVGLRQFR